MYLVKVDVSSEDGGGAVAPLGVDGGAQQAVGGRGQRGVLAGVVVHEAALGGLQDVQVAEASLHADLDVRALALLRLNVGVRLARAETLEGVLVRDDLAAGVRSLQALPVVLDNLHANSVDDIRVLGDEVLAQENAELLGRTEVVLVGHAVYGVLASISGNHILIVALRKSGIHDIPFQQDLNIVLDDVLSPIAVSNNLHQTNSESQQSNEQSNILGTHCMWCVPALSVGVET